MNIVFSEQAWEVFSEDVEKDGVTSQYVSYLINNVKNGQMDFKGANVSEVGNTTVRYKVAADKIIIEAIVEGK